MNHDALTFTAFAAELRDLCAEPDITERERLFKSLRERFADKLPEWREKLEPADKGLALYVEDLRTWDSRQSLANALDRLTYLYEDTLQRGSEGQIIARIAQRAIQRRWR